MNEQNQIVNTVGAAYRNHSGTEINGLVLIKQMNLRVVKYLFGGLSN